jgi:hypothetical protein
MDKLDVDLIENPLAIEGTQFRQILGDRFAKFDSELNSIVNMTQATDPGHQAETDFLIPHHCSRIPDRRFPCVRKRATKSRPGSRCSTRGGFCE